MNAVDKNYPEGLNAILYSLYYIQNVEDDTEYKKLMDELKKNYRPEQLAKYQIAVNWAINNPDTEFNKRLPNLPHSNKNVLTYLIKTRVVLDEILSDIK